MINIADGIKLFDIEIEYRAIRSNGPGGQHVNKVSTAIILKYNLNIHNYPEWFLKSIKINANNAQLSSKNIITIKSNRFRSQMKNKRDATKRLLSQLKLSSKRFAAKGFSICLLSSLLSGLAPYSGS